MQIYRKIKLCELGDGCVPGNCSRRPRPSIKAIDVVPSYFTSYDLAFGIISFLGVHSDINYNPEEEWSYVTLYDEGWPNEDAAQCYIAEGKTVPEVICKAALKREAV